eukprot:COSAG02_NODE_7191_length_3127_cov_15.225892_2_plen_156_part_00
MVSSQVSIGRHAVSENACTTPPLTSLTPLPPFLLYTYHTPPQPSSSACAVQASTFWRAPPANHSTASPPPIHGKSHIVPPLLHKTARPLPLWVMQRSTSPEKHTQHSIGLAKGWRGWGIISHLRPRHRQRFLLYSLRRVSRQSHQAGFQPPFTQF